jgi:hypothetical protein
MSSVLIQIEGSDLPGRHCGPGPDFPDGHRNIHVAVQGRKGQQDLFGLVPADAQLATWVLESEVVTPPPVGICGAPRSKDHRGRGGEEVRLPYVGRWGLDLQHVSASEAVARFRPGRRSQRSVYKCPTQLVSVRIALNHAPESTQRMGAFSLLLDYDVVNFPHLVDLDTGDIRLHIVVEPVLEVVPALPYLRYVKLAVCHEGHVGDESPLELGTKRVRHLDTPHAPLAWDARVLYEETTNTLLCGDLFTHLGDVPAVTTDDIVQPAMDAEAMFRASSLSPDTAIVMRKLGDLAPSTLALMHGSSFSGEGREALYDLASAYESQYLTPS